MVIREGCNKIGRKRSEEQRRLGKGKEERGAEGEKDERRKTWKVK